MKKLLMYFALSILTGLTLGVGCGILNDRAEHAIDASLDAVSDMLEAADSGD